MEQVGRQIGQTVVAENRPGAANTIGIAAVAKAVPDGYTILVTTSGIAIAPFTHKTLPYDTIRDLRAVMPLGNLTNVLITPAGRFKSLQDLVAKAKAKPNAVLRFDRSRQHRKSDGRAAGLSAAASAGQRPRRGRRRSRGPGASISSSRRSPPPWDSFASTRWKRWPSVARPYSLMSDLPTTMEAGYPDSDYNFWISVLPPPRRSRSWRACPTKCAKRYRRTR